ncbi:hypothetical protein D3C72_2274000 [compost metagenome]
MIVTGILVTKTLIWGTALPKIPIATFTKKIVTNTGAHILIANIIAVCPNTAISANGPTFNDNELTGIKS